MKTLNLILCSFLLLMSSCNAQNKKGDSKELSLNTRAENTTEPLSKPDVRFKVNKQYDDKGNVISYDSTYSYSYSGPAQMDVDMKNIFGEANAQFDSPIGFFNMPGVKGAPGDSTFVTPFENDYFEKQMQMNQKLMNEVFKHFHSVQRLPAPDEKTENKGQKKI